MTTTPTTPKLPDLPAGACGPGCIYLDDACRCYDSAPAPAEPTWMTALDPSF